MEIYKLAPFSTPRCRWHPALESPPEDAPLQGCPPQGWLPHVCWDVHSPTLGLVSQLGTSSISSVTASPERKGNGEGQWDMRRGKPHIFRSELKGQLLHNLSGTGMVSLFQAGLSETRPWPNSDIATALSTNRKF